MEPTFLTRRAWLTAMSALASSPVLAQTAQVPATIRLLVGYPAGGPVDLSARMVAPALGRELGTTIVVENRPGANATTAGDAVAKAAPDGTVLWYAASPTLTISPLVMAKMPFDPVRDLAPVGPVLSYYNVLVVNKNQPARSIKELIEYARANPGKLSYGSAGVGGSNHLSGELLAARTSTRMLHVPYKGNAPAMADVIGGQISMMFDVVGSARNYIAADKVRALAVTSPHRNPSLPDVPTMTESGIPDFEVGGWFAVFAPRGLPPALQSRYTQGLRDALRQPELKAKLEAAGYELWLAQPEAVTQRVTRELALWSSVTKGMKLE